MSLDTIGRQEDCRLCDEGRNIVGKVGARGTLVFRTGENPQEDWALALQRSNVSDPDLGFTFLLFPTGHLTSYSQVASKRELATNYGIISAVAHKAMQTIRAEDAPGGITESGIIYGKYGLEHNTQLHIHEKIMTADGPVCQPFPSDTEWTKASTSPCRDGQEIYIRAVPVTKRKIDSLRYEYLAGELPEICEKIARELR